MDGGMRDGLSDVLALSLACKRLHALIHSGTYKILPPEWRRKPFDHTW
jgi:hypothetical protein